MLSANSSFVNMRICCSSFSFLTINDEFLGAEEEIENISLGSGKLKFEGHLG